MDSVEMRMLIGMSFLVFVFWLGREILLWYWKVNHIVGLLESIDESLKQLPAVREYDRYAGRGVKSTV